MLRMLVASLCLGSAGMSAFPCMAEVDEVAGRRLYANCAACHGTDGRPAGEGLPPLAGQPKHKLIASMRAFKAGEREATIMHQIAKGYSDEQISLIAGFLSAQARQEAR